VCICDSPATTMLYTCMCLCNLMKKINKCVYCCFSSSRCEILSLLPSSTTEPRRVDSMMFSGSVTHAEGKPVLRAGWKLKNTDPAHSLFLPLPAILLPTCRLQDHREKKKVLLVTGDPLEVWALGARTQASHNPLVDAFIPGALMKIYQNICRLSLCWSVCVKLGLHHLGPHWNYHHKSVCARRFVWGGQPWQEFQTFRSFFFSFFFLSFFSSSPFYPSRLFQKRGLNPASTPLASTPRPTGGETERKKKKRRAVQKVHTEGRL